MRKSEEGDRPRPRSRSKERERRVWKGRNTATVSWIFFENHSPAAPLLCIGLPGRRSLFTIIGLETTFPSHPHEPREQELVLLEFGSPGPNSNRNIVPRERLMNR